MNVIEKYCFIKTQYLIDDMMYKKNFKLYKRKSFFIL